MGAAGYLFIMRWCRQIRRRGRGDSAALFYRSGNGKGAEMVEKYRFNLRIKMIYICIIVLFISVIMAMNYAFQRSRNLLIRQEAGIISQYMNRNELALKDVSDSIRKISAASSTNKEVAALLNQTNMGKGYSLENINRISQIEASLTFYRNIFFDYRLHYIILGVDGTVYSVVDGIDNRTYFGEQFARSVRQQSWYQEFLDGSEVSRWITPCRYNGKGAFSQDGGQNGDETFILFVRRIRDYNTQRFLGVSFVSFPTENLRQILIPYEGASLALLSEHNELIYANGADGIPSEIILSGMDSKGVEEQGYFHYDNDGVEYLINYVTVEGSDWKIASALPLTKTTEAVDALSKTVFTMMLLIALGASALCLMMYIYINAPLNRLIKKVSRVNIGGTRIADVDVVGRPVFGIIEAEQGIGQMVDHIEKLSEQALQQKEIEQNLRYEMLRAQLNPHFLFNTLNAIKWSALISGAGNIADMITSLGILLENSMNRRDEEVPLGEEIKVVKAWVEIKNWALKDRIQVHVDIPEELERIQVIKFCLQPLVENAVLHGMDGTEHGEIWVTARRFGDKISIEIRDNGVGMNRDKLNQIMMEMDSNEKRRHVTGIGLTSIHELMKIKYGPDYGLHIESQSGEGTTVYVVFPGKVREDAEGSDC